MYLLCLCDSERVWHGFLWGNVSHIWWFSRCPYAEQLAGVSASTIPLMIQFTLVRHPLLKVCEWHCSPPVALLESMASSSEPRTTPVCVCVRKRQWERRGRQGEGMRRRRKRPLISEWMKRFSGESLRGEAPCRGQCGNELDEAVSVWPHVCPHTTLTTLMADWHRLHPACNESLPVCHYLAWALS